MVLGDGAQERNRIYIKINNLEEIIVFTCHLTYHKMISDLLLPHPPVS